MTQFDRKTFAAALKAGGVLMVEFWADWCGPCSILEPVVDGLEKTYGDKVLVGKLNIDIDRELTSLCGIKAVPTVIVYKDGKEVGRKSGVKPAKEYIKILEKCL